MAKDSAARIELGRSFHQEGAFHFSLWKWSHVYTCDVYTHIHKHTVYSNI